MSEGIGAVSVEDVRHVADPSSVEPMAQVGQALGLKAAVNGETLRMDEVKPSVDRGSVMAAAPETDGRFFKVPKVIAR